LYIGQANSHSFRSRTKARVIARAKASGNISFTCRVCERKRNNTFSR